MSIKDKFSNLLFGEKPEEEQTAPEEAEAAGEVTGEPGGASASSLSLLELPEDHPIYRLHSQRRHEAGYLPAPRVCLDETGMLPPETVRRELDQIGRAHV